MEEGGEESSSPEIADNMRREFKTAVRNQVKQQVLDAVIDKHEGQDVPKALIDSEINTMRQQMFQQFGGAGSEDMDMESLLPAEMFAEQAERRVKLGLVLNEMVTSPGQGHHLYINSPGGWSPQACRSTTPCSSSSPTSAPCASARRPAWAPAAGGRRQGQAFCLPHSRAS